MALKILALMAAIQSSQSQSRKSHGGSPPALLTRMSGLGQTAKVALRPSTVVISATTVVTLAPVILRMSSAIASRFPFGTCSNRDARSLTSKQHSAGSPRPLEDAKTNTLFTRNSWIHCLIPYCLVSSNSSSTERINGIETRLFFAKDSLSAMATNRPKA